MYPERVLVRHRGFGQLDWAGSERCATVLTRSPTHCSLRDCGCASFPLPMEVSRDQTSAYQFRSADGGTQGPYIRATAVRHSGARRVAARRSACRNVPRQRFHRRIAAFTRYGQTRMTNEDVRAGGGQRARCAEASRIEFLLQRDGPDTTQIWVRRTLAIYRRSVLDRKHFAHTAQYRRKFVVSYLGFRHWLASNSGYGSRGTASPHYPVGAKIQFSL
jgi:hypothetical protein